MPVMAAVFWLTRLRDAWKSQRVIHYTCAPCRILFTSPDVGASQKRPMNGFSVSLPKDSGMGLSQT